VSGFTVQYLRQKCIVPEGRERERERLELLRCYLNCKVGYTMQLLV